VDNAWRLGVRQGDFIRHRRAGANIGDPEALDLEAEGGTSAVLDVRRNGIESALHVNGGELVSATTKAGLESTRVKFAPGSGYQENSVSLSW